MCCVTAAAAPRGPRLSSPALQTSTHPQVVAPGMCSPWAAAPRGPVLAQLGAAPHASFRPLLPALLVAELVPRFSHCCALWRHGEQPTASQCLALFAGSYLSVLRTAPASFAVSFTSQISIRQTVSRTAELSVFSASHYTEAFVSGPGQGRVPCRPLGSSQGSAGPSIHFTWLSSQAESFTFKSHSAISITNTLTGL